MPRHEIDLPERVEYLSILDEDGNVDKALEPPLEDGVLLRMFRIMLLGRRFDERALNLQRQGRIGTFAPTTGHEAAGIGSIMTLGPADWVIPSYRETPALLWRSPDPGVAMENLLTYIGGLEEGALIPEGANVTPISVPVGSQTLHAAGIGWAIKYRKSGQVAMTYFGDGATSQGDFHEALNFAGVFEVPVVFVCQNNQWAISVPRARQTRSKTLAQKALAHGVRGVQVDGNDILAVYVASKEAVERARSGGGPTMIECVTYRLVMHTTADDPKRYRTEEEVEMWRKRDPLSRFRKHLENRGLLDESKVGEIEAEVKAEIQGAVERAEATMKENPDPLFMFENMYAELTPDLRDQRAELAGELAGEEGK
jgi:pyruvate dehydrogenase E1 component alpha subunit